MDVEILSEKGKQKFTENGFIYVFDTFSKSDNSIKFWRCEKRKECKARVHTRNGEVLKKINDHCHDSSAVSVEVAQVVTKVKKRAVETIEGTIQVINECMVNTTQAAQAVLPNTCSLRKLVRRKRNEVNAAPPNPLTLADLLLPDDYKTYKLRVNVTENFLLADNQDGAERILIFGRQTWLPYLETSSVWYADGTFSIAPPLFSQVYTLMGVINNGVHPICYALLPNKMRGTYQRMFELLKELLPNLNPLAINCDFEHAAFTAMKTSFPNVNIYGCFFHMAQNMKKKIGGNGSDTGIQ
ncbi:uncharacterized protein LOC116167424 [Photinus pyralis]|nr:uncharacterized protein LOC116167218 [Photinus pyralis]XP_031338650.1 uncharacterized protein LOC116167424 [Photinus pyralis]